MTEILCGCGKELHYTDPDVERAVTEIIEKQGPTVIVHNSEGRKFNIPRHYIALHGVREVDIVKLAQQYGWSEVL